MLRLNDYTARVSLTVQNRSNSIHRIYINEDLSLSARKLFGKLRWLVKSKCIKSIWSMNHKIIVKKNDDVLVRNVQSVAGICL